MAQDPFDLLGVTPAFDLDVAQVERSYRARIAGLHPDVAGADDVSADTAAVNLARATLIDPERRAGALLDRLGGPRPEQDRSLPGAFLAEMLEVREEAEAAIAGTDRDAQERWRVWAKGRRAEILADVAARFRSLGDPPGDPVLRELRKKLNAWRYIERMIEQLHRPEAT